MNIYPSNKILILLLFTIVLCTFSGAQAVNDAIYPNSVSVQADYILSDTVVTTGDTLTLLRTCINNEASALTSFYFCDILPDDFTMLSHSVFINNSVVSYDYPTPSASTAFTNYSEYNWVLDYPGTHGVYDLIVQPDDTIVIEYKVLCLTVGEYDLPLHTFIGHNGTTGVFGFSDSLKVRFSLALDIDDNQSLPNSFILGQNYPNPFNPTTTIEFSIPVKSFVLVEVYNLLGQSVTKLVQKNLSAGDHTVTWNGLTENGESAPSGVYFYKLVTENNIISKKMLLLK